MVRLSVMPPAPLNRAGRRRSRRTKRARRRLNAPTGCLNCSALDVVLAVDDSGSDAGWSPPGCGTPWRSAPSASSGIPDDTPGSGVVHSRIGGAPELGLALTLVEAPPRSALAAAAAKSVAGPRPAGSTNVAAGRPPRHADPAHPPTKRRPARSWQVLTDGLRTGRPGRSRLCLNRPTPRRLRARDPRRPGERVLVPTSRGRVARPRPRVVLPAHLDQVSAEPALAWQIADVDAPAPPARLCPLIHSPTN